MSYGQDIHFSQFYATPLTLNPAATGDFTGAWRVTAIGRQQGNLDFDSDQGEPFNTLGIGFDAPIKWKKNRFGVGLHFVNDASGQAQYSTTRITGSLAFETRVSGNKLRFGLQPSLVQFGTEINEMTTDSDLNTDADRYDTGNVFNTGSFSVDIPKGKYFDLNVGALWSKKFGKLTPTAGFAVNHIVKPNYSVFEGNETSRMPMRFVYNISADYDYNDKISLHPNFLFMGQSVAQDVVLGVNLGYSLEGRIEMIKKVFIGPEFRMLSGKNKATNELNNSDSFILIAGVELPKWRVGVSRDMTVVSNAREAFQRIPGAWEVSVIFTAPDVNLKKKLIPCDRY